MSHRDREFCLLMLCEGPLESLRAARSLMFLLLAAAFTLGAAVAQEAQQTAKDPAVAKTPWVKQHYRDGSNPLDLLPKANTSTPVPAFKGNLTTLPPFGNGIYPGLIRQANCSLSLITAGYYSTAPDSTVDSYEKVLHAQAQLASRPDVFAGGCKDPVLGEMAHFATIVGTTSKGYYVGAIGQLNGEETEIHTYVYDAVHHKQISSGVNRVGSNAGNISVGDVNGDGINDMVVPYGAGSTGGVAVFLGNADGTFKAAAKYTLPFFPESVVLNDFNGDGKPDVAVNGVTASNKAEIGVLLNKGKGTFQAAKISKAPSSAYFMISADFNSDKKADLAWGDGTEMLGNGDGTFRAAPQLWAAAGPTPPYYSGMVAADFNHDGKLDLAAVSSVGESIAIFEGRGDGTFAFKGSYALIFGVFELAATDLDGDGHLDLVMGEYGDGGFTTGENQAGTVQVLMGNGDGTFQGAALYPRFGTTQISGVRSFAVGDVTGNGKDDLVGQRPTVSATDSLTNSLSVLVGDGTGRFSQGPLTPMQATDEYDVQVADLRGNDKLDALTIGSVSDTNTAPALHVYFGKGNGTFESGTAYALPGAPSNFAVGDVNGDGKPDVVVLIASVNQLGESVPGKPGLYELLNKGDGTLEAPKLIDGKLTGGSTVLLANLGNGKTDIVVQQNGNVYSTPPVPGDVRVYLGHGNGMFEAATTYVKNTYGGGALAVADVAGSGKADIVTTIADYKEGSLTNSRLVVLPNKGNGTFGSPIATAQSDELPFLSDIAVGDFNGDGKLDVAQGECCGMSNTYLFLGNGDGTFQAPLALSVGGSSTSLTAVQIKGTKYPDLIVGSTGNGYGADVVVLENLYGADLPGYATAAEPVTKEPKF
jgi:hypothetical protein